MMTQYLAKDRSTLGAAAADALLGRIDALALASSNRHMIDYLPREAAIALFDELVARADHEITVTVRDDAGVERAEQIGALRRERADLVPFLVEDPCLDAARNKGTEGFASLLRDHYAVGAERPRYLLTITAKANETQKSAQDGAADKRLVDLGVLLHTALDMRGVVPESPLRRVADVYVAFQKRAVSWRDVHARWEEYLAEVADLSEEEQGQRLHLLGCFLPDRSAGFASTGGRIQILPQSDDQRHRRLGDPLSNTRLYDNAVLRRFFDDVLTNPIEDPEHVLREVFEDAPQKAKEIVKGGVTGLAALELDTFAGMVQIRKGREKNAFQMDRLSVDGAVFFRPFEQAGTRILVATATTAVCIRLGLKRPYNSRKEHAQIVSWRRDKVKPDPQVAHVVENATEVVFDVPAPEGGSFAVYRLALTSGPRSLARPIDALFFALYGSSSPEIVVEEDRQISLDDQAWIAEEDARFVRYTSDGDAEAKITSRDEVGASHEDESVAVAELTLADCDLRPRVVGRTIDLPNGDIDELGAFEHEKLLELAAYTTKVGERTRATFAGVECYLDAVSVIDMAANRWRVDLTDGSSRQIFASGKNDGPDGFLYEQAVARFLSSPETIVLRWSHDGGFRTGVAVDGPKEGGGRFFEARKIMFDALREVATKHVPRVRRGSSDAGVPLWLLPLHSVGHTIDTYLDAWCAAVDDAFESKRYEAVHDRLLQVDTLLIEDGAGIQRLVLLPTNPWLLASLRAYQSRMVENFRGSPKKPLPLRRNEVEQLVPRTALEDWYLAQHGGVRLRLSDSAPFHLEFLPEKQHLSRGTLDYVERVVANKVERYLRMHPHLRHDRRTLRIGFVNPGNGEHLLNGLRRWLEDLLKERNDRLRVLPEDEIPAIDVFLFSTRGDEDVGSAFEQFFLENVQAADDNVVQKMMVARLRYRKSSEKGPKSAGDGVHICFVHSLVDSGNQSNKTGPLAEWWDGGFGDGLLATYLRRALPGASGQLHSRRGLWLDPESKGLRGALARLVALQRGCRDSDLERSKAIYWECPLPDVASLHDVYQYSDWVVHLDRELSLELFMRDRDPSKPTIIEYSDQEVPESPGYDTITVTKYADPYREQLGEILTTVALDIQGRGDAAKEAAHAILEDINVLSGSWALDFLMGSIAGKRYSLRLKGNVGSALVYRWLKRVEWPHQSGKEIDTNVGLVVPVVVSLEDLLRVTPATGLRKAAGLAHRYTNEVSDDNEDASKYCDDLLVLYVTRTTPGTPSRLYGRIIEVKFGTTASAARDKAVLQVQNTNRLLQSYLGGASTSVEAPFRHKQLSLLLKAQLEQAVAMRVFSPEIYDFLNVPALSANLATGNYEVDYTLGIDGQHAVGDAFLLDTRADDDGAKSTLRVDSGVRVITVPRDLVEWLTFEPDQGPTLRGGLLDTVPRLGRYQNIKTQTGRPRRVSVGPVEGLNLTEGGSEAVAENVGGESAAAPTSEGSTIAVAPLDAPSMSAEERAAEESDVVGAAAQVEAESVGASDVPPRVSLEEACRVPIKEAPYDDATVVEAVARLERALRGHKINLAVPLSARETDRGPRLLRAYVRLQAGESINSLRRISEDLARDVGTESSDLHITNVPERHAVGVDLPLRGLTYGVSFSELIDHPSFGAAEEELALGFCAGIDVTGRPVWVDLLQMPHMLVAGTTGSGKTVFLRNVILSLLLQNAPERMVLRLSSSKPMDFRIFTQVPHAAGAPMATDAAEALQMVRKLVEEMDQRIALISDAYCDNLSEYNRENGASALPYVVAILDEYAEMVASFDDKQERAEFESAVGRLAQKARAAGIHLVICMQRPDANALKGAIKANILHRFALKLPQQHDSQIILDEGGAETLLGQGDLLHKDASNRVYRLQVPSLDNAYLKDVLRRFEAGSQPFSVALDRVRTCPNCGRSGTIRELFGMRRTRHRRRDGAEIIAERAQSYCMRCRGGGSS